MGVRLIGMKRQRIPMVETERLAREVSNGSQELVRRGTRRHGKEQLMNELARLMACREVGSRGELVQIKVPVFDKATGRRFVSDPLSIVGLEHPVLAIRNVPQVPSYGRQVIAARTDDSDDYFRGSIAETRGTHPGSTTSRKSYQPLRDRWLEVSRACGPRIVRCRTEMSAETVPIGG